MFSKNKFIVSFFVAASIFINIVPLQIYASDLVFGYSDKSYGGTTYGRTFVEESYGKKFTALYDAMVSECSKVYNDEETHIDKYFSFTVNAAFKEDDNAAVQHTIWIVENDNPAFYFLGHGGYSWSLKDNVTTVRIYLGDKYHEGTERKQNKDLIWNTIKEYEKLIDKAKINTNYDKARFIQNYLMNGTNYLKDTKDNDKQSVIGAFNHKGAVCEGFNEAYMLLANYFKVPTLNFWGINAKITYKEKYDPSKYTHYIKSMLNSVDTSHQWSMTQADDGKWYIVDTTSGKLTVDDPFNKESPWISRIFIPESEFVYKPYISFPDTRIYTGYPYPENLGTKPYTKTDYVWLVGESHDGLVNINNNGTRNSFYEAGVSWYSPDRSMYNNNLGYYYPDYNGRPLYIVRYLEKDRDYIVIENTVLNKSNTRYVISGIGKFRDVLTVTVRE